MSSHDSLLRQAERLRNNFKDLVDMSEHAQARRVHSSIELLISNLHAKKSREAIDTILKQLISELQRVEEDVMDLRHSNQLIGLCENLNREASKL